MAHPKSKYSAHQSGVSEEILDYSAANATGTLEDQVNDFTTGGSQVELFDAGSGITNIIENYTGADGTGDITTAVQHNTDGTFNDITFNYSNGTEVSYTVDGFGPGGNEIYFESFSPDGSYIAGSGGLTGYG